MDIKAIPEISTVLSQIDALLAGVFNDRRVAGMSAALIHDQQMVWSRGYGCSDIEKGIPADERTVYDIGSIVKMFTDTMLMQLRDAGKVNLDDPIEKHLPEFSIHNPYSDPRPPTFRQIAGHIAGIPREPGYLFDGSSGPRLEPMERVLANVREMQLVYPPLTGVHYSNLAVYIMGYALARAAGQPYKQYVREHILSPLGMCDSDWAPTPQMAERLAKRYLPLIGDQPRRTVSGVDFGDTGAPGGGFLSTINDMAQFVMLQFRAGPAGGRQILGSTSLREMRLPIYGDQGWGVGVGWFLEPVAGRASVKHGGSGPGCSAMLHFIPDLKLGFVVLLNEMNFAEDALAKQALELAAPAFANVFEVKQVKTLNPLPPQPERYVGAYDTPEGWGMDVQIVDGALRVFMKYAGVVLLSYDLNPQDEGHFVISGSSFDGEPATCEFDAAGGVKGLLLWGLPFNKVA
jgi:CubicO group peptidase (beta-lactamase class C family)